jgi:hypothetical protein
MTTLANQVFSCIAGLYGRGFSRRMTFMSESTTSVTQRRAAAVVMERTPLNNRWASEKWEAKSVLPDLDPAAPPRVLVEDEGRLQVLHSGLQITLQRDEAEGYYMNITSPQPKVFVLWRMEDAVAKPQLLTVSYHEGSRWLDSGETVDGVPLPLELLPWMAQFCNEHYKPEPRKKAKYATSRDKGRMGNWRPD